MIYYYNVAATFIKPVVSFPLLLLVIPATSLFLSFYNAGAVQKVLQRQENILCSWPYRLQYAIFNRGNRFLHSPTLPARKPLAQKLLPCCLSDYLPVWRLCNKSSKGKKTPLNTSHTGFSTQFLIEEIAFYTAPKHLPTSSDSSSSSAEPA